MTEREPEQNEASLEQLAEGMRRVANGQFDTKLPDCTGGPYRSIIRDFNRMTDSLIEVEALRESFVSDVAHEFKTPLAYIQGYATLLQDDDLSPEMRNRYTKNICNATQRLANMVGTFLDISNLSRPTARLETNVFSLDEQLRHVMALFMPQIERKNLSYEVDLEEVDIDANESLLENIWVNLLSNALKYTKDGGHVGVSLERRSRQAIVMVSDTGCGMTKNQIRHAFDRFYQGDQSHMSTGTGLGLAIVKAVAKKHGGTVSIESELYRGTTFTVILPLKQTR